MSEMPVQGRHQLLPRHGVLHQRRHGGAAAVDLRGGQQRPLQPRCAASRPPMAVFVLSSTHRRLPFFSLLRRVSVSSRLRRAVRSSSMNWPRSVVFQIVHVGQVGLLRLVQVAQQRAQRQQRRRVVPRQAVQRVLAELAADQLLAPLPSGSGLAGRFSRWQFSLSCKKRHAASRRSRRLSFTTASAGEKRPSSLISCFTRSGPEKAVAWALPVEMSQKHRPA